MKKSKFSTMAQQKKKKTVAKIIKDSGSKKASS